MPETKIQEIYGAVIPAAGLSSRMKDFKPLLKIGEYGLPEREIRTFSECGVDLQVVVTGYRGRDLEEGLSKALPDHNICFVHNPDYASTQMFDSLKLGLEKLSGKCTRVFICPADIPLFSAETVKLLMRTEGRVVIPVSGGEEGHPLLIGAELIPAILAHDGTDGLRGALGRAAETVYCEVEDPGCLLDADTPQDLQKLRLLALSDKR